MKAARRARARTAALQSLYELEAFSPWVLRWRLKILPITSRLPQWISSTTVSWSKGVSKRRRELDDTLRGASDRWRLERFLVIDHVILRIALLELIDELAPPAVVIAEAVKLGAKYGSEDSASSY